MMPRVAIDCRAATARMSGVGRYVVNLVGGLAAAGPFRLLALTGADPHPALAELAGVEIVATGWTAGLADPRRRLAWEQGDLARILDRLRPDLFHATWNHGIPWRCPCPAVLTLHDLLPLQDAGQAMPSPGEKFFNNNASCPGSCQGSLSCGDSGLRCMCSLNPFAASEINGLDNDGQSQLCHGSRNFCHVSAANSSRAGQPSLAGKLSPAILVMNYAAGLRRVMTGQLQFRCDEGTGDR